MRFDLNRPDFFDTGKQKNKLGFIQLLFLGMGLSLILFACGSEEPEQIAGSVSTPPTATNTLTAVPTESLTNTITPTPSNTPTATPTNTPTPTPTPTTLPVAIFGDPIADTRTGVEPTFRTSCGEVDTLDFPMDPPNALAYSRGGRDFGVFRARYDKFHAGEDWWKSGGVLGESVHSIGNGRITYAQPNGWGRDKGVIIIEHVFNDGRKILSFYGHLDEESFEVFTGECVVRGQFLAKVGRPRTPPHLHFEMRSQAPDRTLGGYWDIDPRTAGWVWPSMRIWEERLMAQVGTRWVRPLENTGIQQIGQLPSGRYAILENDTLLSINIETGLAREFLNFIESPTNAQVSEGRLYVTQQDAQGLIFEFNENNLLNTAAVGEFPAQPPNNDMLRRPGGGVVVVLASELTGIDGNGNRLWTTQTTGNVVDHVYLEDELIISIEGDTQQTWKIPYLGAPEKLADITGQLATSNGVVWIYSEMGLYRINLNNEVETVATFDETRLNLSDITPLEAGGVMLAHVDKSDQRLLVFSSNGQMSWERSVRDLGRSSLRLETLNGRPYLITEEAVNTTNTVSIYEIRPEQNQLEKVLEAGTRFPYPIDTWFETVNGFELLINVGGGPMLLFDPLVDPE